MRRCNVCKKNIVDSDKEAFVFSKMSDICTSEGNIDGLDNEILVWHKKCFPKKLLTILKRGKQE